MSALLDHLWQSTWFAAAVWLVTLALRGNGAAVRHSLWMLASVKFLVPFSALVAIGGWIGMPGDYPDAVLPAPGRQALDVTLLVTPSSQLPVPASGASGVLFALAAMWLAGCLLIARRWLVAWRGARAMARAATPVAAGFDVDLRASHAASEPAVAGILAPVVLVPAGLVETLSREQLLAICAHEREHIQRRDNLKHSVHLLVETLFWFHPMVWWIGRRLVDERERACDEAVLDGGCAAPDYASGIIAVCRHCCRRVRGTYAISAISGDLPRRIALILRDARPAALGFFKGMALTSLMAAVVVVPVGAGALRDRDARRESFASNLLALRDASVAIMPAAGGGGRGIAARGNVVTIRNSSLRDLVAAAYGVQRYQIVTADGWLDSERYDIRAVANTRMSDPERLDPRALQGLVAKLLAARFELEIYVNNRRVD